MPTLREITNEPLIVQSGEAAIRQQAIHEMMLDELKEVRKERDLYYEQLTDAHRKQLKDSLTFESLKGHLFKMLDEHEGMWDSKGFEPDGTFAQDYIEAATAARLLGRKSDRVEEVKTWLGL